MVLDFWPRCLWIWEQRSACQTEKLKCVSLSRSEDSNKRPPGTPGTPGSRDLEAALRRLSLRRDNYLLEKHFFEEESERKLAYKEEEKGGGESSRGPGTPTESLLSLCSHPAFGSVWSGFSFTARSYLPEKLQIVKPLEGDYSFQSRKASNPTYKDKKNQSQKCWQNENDIYQIKHQNENVILVTKKLNYIIHPPQSYIQIDPHLQNLNQPLQNLQQNQYLIWQSHNNIFLSTSWGCRSLWRSSSFDEQSSLPSTKLYPRAFLALTSGLLGVLKQQEGGLKLQHSFYFRYTQPRCWFEV